MIAHPNAPRTAKSLQTATAPAHHRREGVPARRLYVGIWRSMLPVAVAAVLTTIASGLPRWSSVHAADAPPKKPGGPYEFALLDKSYTGEWRDEKEFRKVVEDMFGVTKVQKLKFNSEELRTWLDKHADRTTKLICLVDGWTSADLKQIDVRGWRGTNTFKHTFKVDGRKWKVALTNAKEYAESQP